MNSTRVINSHAFGGGGGGSGPITASWVDSVTGSAMGTDAEFLSVDFGSAFPTRSLVLLFAYRSGAVDASPTVTIGGVAAVVNAFSATSSSPAFHTGVAWAEVPTGTSGAVDLSIDNSIDWLEGDLFSLSHVNSIHDTASANGSGNPSASIAVLADGLVVGAGASSSKGPAATWSNITVVSDINTAASDDCFTSAVSEVEATASPTVDVEFRGLPSSFSVMQLVSFA